MLMAPRWLKWAPLICEMKKMWIIVVMKGTQNPGVGCAYAFIKRKRSGGCVDAQARPGNWTMKMICESLVCQEEARIS